jgi:hypothetical protein
MNNAHESYQLRWMWFRFVAAHKIGAGAKLIAWALADHINRESGKAWPSHDTIAAKTGVSSRQVRNGLRFLNEAAQLIAIERRGGGISRTCVYALRQLDEAKAHEDKRSTKPGNQLPSEPGNNRSNPEIPSIEPGNLRSTEVPRISYNLKTDLTTEPNKKYLIDDHHILPSIDYSMLTGAEELPGGYVTYGGGDHAALVYTTRYAVRYLGYVPDDRPNGMAADQFIAQLFPPLHWLKWSVDAGTAS